MKNYEKKGNKEEGGKNFNSNGLSDIDIDNLLTNRHKNGYYVNKLHQLRFLRDKKTRLQYSLNRLN